MTPTHRYTGPDTLWGLKTNDKGQIEGKGPSGMLCFRRDHDRKLFTVARSHLVPL